MHDETMRTLLSRLADDMVEQLEEMTGGRVETEFAYYERSPWARLSFTLKGPFRNREETNDGAE